MSSTPHCEITMNVVEICANKNPDCRNITYSVIGTSGPAGPCVCPETRFHICLKGLTYSSLSSAPPCVLSPPRSRPCSPNPAPRPARLSLPACLSLRLSLWTVCPVVSCTSVCLCPLALFAVGVRLVALSNSADQAEACSAAAGSVSAMCGAVSAMRGSRG